MVGKAMVGVGGSKKLTHKKGRKKRRGKSREW